VRIALDTNRYIDFCKGVPEAVKFIREAERIFLPLIVLGELRGGFLSGSRSKENEVILSRFINSPRVDILCPDEQTSHHYARLYFQLRRQGTPIPTNDLWVAALVVQHDLLICARDRHFDLIPQLPRLS
jgi:tRNA(fMet)-specific endonuclease VapC